MSTVGELTKYLVTPDDLYAGQVPNKTDNVTPLIV